MAKFPMFFMVKSVKSKFLMLKIQVFPIFHGEIHISHDKIRVFPGFPGEIHGFQQATLLAAAEVGDGAQLLAALEEAKRPDEA